MTDPQVIIFCTSNRKINITNNCVFLHYMFDRYAACGKMEYNVRDDETD